LTLPDQQLICTRPFDWFEIHPDGSVFLCCPAWLRRPVGNLLNASIDDIWNGPRAQEVRKSILNGSFHFCNARRCPKRAGPRDPVQTLRDVEDDPVRRAIRAGRAQLDYPPRQLNLCFDRHCNLACPSCRPRVWRPSPAELETRERILDIVTSDLLPGASGISLSGQGDPFASPAYFSLLQQLTPKAFPRLRSLRLHSNGQLFSRQTWERLPGIHRLLSEIEISLDAATEATYRRNRPGGKLARVLTNLEFLKKLPVRRVLSMVVQQNNWREIPQFLDLARCYDAEAYLAPLVNWGTFPRIEYRQRAVHHPEHPEHADFAALLWQVRNQPQLMETVLLPQR